MADTVLADTGADEGFLLALLNSTPVIDGAPADDLADPAVVDSRDGGHARQFRREHGGGLLAAHDRLQRLADPQHVPQFGLGAAPAGGGQPGRHCER